jgi:hypothetical protein
MKFLKLFFKVIFFAHLDPDPDSADQIKVYLSLGLHKRYPSHRTSLQPPKKEHPALQIIFQIFRVIYRPELVF